MKLRIKYNKTRDNFNIEYRTILYFYWRNAAYNGSPLERYISWSYNSVGEAKAEMLKALVKNQKKIDELKIKSDENKDLNIIIDSGDIKDIVPEQFL